MVVGWVGAVVVRWVVCLARWWLNGNGDFGICFEMENSGERKETDDRGGRSEKKKVTVFFFFLFKFRDKIVF